MKTWYMTLGVAALLGTPAVAQDVTQAKVKETTAEKAEAPNAATPAPAPAKPITVYIDNYATYDDTGLFQTNHELDIVLEGTAGDWTLGAEGWIGLLGDFTASTLTVETPTLRLYAKSDAYGELDVWDATNALGNACITPTAGSTHFDTEALMTFGTCAGYSGQAITYISPSFYDGFGLQVSAMKDLTGLSAVGDVDSSVSAALTYTKTTDANVTYSAILGVDAATSINGGVASGTPLPLTVQGGATVAWDGWTIGGAAQYEYNSIAGGDRFGAGVGVGKAVTEQLTLGTEVAYDAYQDAGVNFQETSLGSTAEFKIVENMSIDGALNLLHRTGDDGTDTNAWQVGTGLSVSF